MNRAEHKTLNAALQGVESCLPGFLCILKTLRVGALNMSRQQFRNALKRSIGASKDYADGCWIDFQDAPLHYICSRTNDEQGIELIKKCLDIGIKKEKSQ